jgi:hypothetical protein
MRDRAPNGRRSESFGCQAGSGDGQLRGKGLECGAPGQSRTADLLVRSHERSKNQQFSNSHSGYVPCPMVAIWRRLQVRAQFDAGNAEQAFYVGAGHRIGHSTRY